MDAYSSANRYLETTVNTASPAKLVVLLYQGAIRFMHKAIGDIEKKDLVAKRDSIARALAIVQELHGTLNLERGGEIAAELDRLYDFVTSRLLEGSMRLDVKPVQEALQVMTNLGAAWEELANQNAKAVRA